MWDVAFLGKKICGEAEVGFKAWREGVVFLSCRKMVEYEGALLNPVLQFYCGKVLFIKHLLVRRIRHCLYSH